MAEKTSFSLYINISLKRRLQEVSTKADISMAKIIDEILEESLPKYEKKYSVQPKLRL